MKRMGGDKAQSPAEPVTGGTGGSEFLPGSSLRLADEIVVFQGGVAPGELR